jgi:hypothetical protein
MGHVRFLLSIFLSVFFLSSAFPLVSQDSFTLAPKNIDYDWDVLEQQVLSHIQESDPSVRKMTLEILEGPREALFLDSNTLPVAAHMLVPVIASSFLAAVNTLPFIAKNSKIIKTPADEASFYAIFKTLKKIPNVLFFALSAEGASGGSATFEKGRLYPGDLSSLGDTGIALKTFIEEINKAELNDFERLQQVENKIRELGLLIPIVRLVIDPVEITNGLVRGYLAFLAQQEESTVEGLNSIARTNVAQAYLSTMKVTAPDKDKLYLQYFASRAKQDNGIDIQKKTLSQNLFLTAKALGKPIQELKLGMLYRHRMDGTIREAILAGIDSGDETLNAAAAQYRSLLIANEIFKKNEGLIQNYPEREEELKNLQIAQTFNTLCDRFVENTIRAQVEKGPAAAAKLGNFHFVKDGDANFVFSLIHENLDVSLGCGGPAERLYVAAAHKIAGLPVMQAQAVSKTNTEKPLTQYSFHRFSKIIPTNEELKVMREFMQPLFTEDKEKKYNEQDSSTWVFSLDQLFSEGPIDGVVGMGPILPLDPDHAGDIPLKGLIVNTDKRIVQSEIALLTPKGLVLFKATVTHDRQIFHGRRKENPLNFSHYDTYYPSFIFKLLKGRADLITEEELPHPSDFLGKHFRNIVNAVILITQNKEEEKTREALFKTKTIPELLEALKNIQEHKYFKTSPYIKDVYVMTASLLFHLIEDQKKSEDINPWLIRLKPIVETLKQRYPQELVFEQLQERLKETPTPIETQTEIAKSA